MPKSIEVYLGPKTSVIIPLVKGTVDNHNIPRRLAKIKTVNSVLGERKNTRNKTDLNE